MQSTENTPSSSAETNLGTLEQLSALIQESLQIYELEHQKTSIIDELYNSLKIITEFLRFSVNVHPTIFNLPVETHIMLLPDLNLSIRSTNGKTELKSLNSYSPDAISKILEYVIPQIVELIKTEKSYLTEKITFLRSASKQLNQVNHLREGLLESENN